MRKKRKRGRNHKGDYQGTSAFSLKVERNVLRLLRELRFGADVPYLRLMAPCLMVAAASPEAAGELPAGLRKKEGSKEKRIREIGMA